VNWNNKAQNISELSKELNNGLNSFVFVDDSPTECDLVRHYLTEVTVRQVPNPLYSLPSLLLEEGLFQSISRSNEDQNRSSLYHEQSRRLEFETTFNNIDDYLASLGLSIMVREMVEDEIPRVAQLTQKTNQFNLTTKRYSEKDIQKFSASSDNLILTLRVQDKFGGYGLTGVFIVTKKKTSIFVDSLLLSCRILGKKLELVFVTSCMDFVQSKWLVPAWEAAYKRTEKNGQVQSFWSLFGYNPVCSTEESCVYELNEKNRKSFSFEYIKTEL